MFLILFLGNKLSSSLVGFYTTTLESWPPFAEEVDSSPWSDDSAIAAPSLKTGIDDWLEQKNKVGKTGIDDWLEQKSKVGKTGLDDWLEQKNKVGVEEAEEDGVETDSPMKALLRPNLWDEVRRDLSIWIFGIYIFFMRSVDERRRERASEQHRRAKERLSKRVARVMRLCLTLQGCALWHEHWEMHEGIYILSDWC